MPHNIRKKLKAAEEVLEEQVEKASKKVAFRIAQRAAGKLRQVILDQAYAWTPLTQPYLRKKIREGLDTRILRATGEYAASIAPRWSEEKKAFVISAADRPHARTKASLKQIGEWLEYGTRNKDGSVRMPPRPHWRPFQAWAETQTGEWREEYVKKVWEEVERALKGRIHA